jgi:hypothetical protein
MVLRNVAPLNPTPSFGSNTEFALIATREESLFSSPSGHVTHFVAAILRNVAAVSPPGTRIGKLE